MKTLHDITMEYITNNTQNIDPTNFYGGEIERDIIRSTDIVDAVLGLTSGMIYPRVLRCIHDIIEKYLEQY